MSARINEDIAELNSKLDEILTPYEVDGINYSAIGKMVLINAVLSNIPLKIDTPLLVTNKLPKTALSHSFLSLNEEKHGYNISAYVTDKGELYLQSGVTSSDNRVYLQGVYFSK